LSAVRLTDLLELLVHGLEERRHLRRRQLGLLAGLGQRPDATLRTIDEARLDEIEARPADLVLHLRLASPARPELPSSRSASTIGATKRRNWGPFGAACAADLEGFAMLFSDETWR